LPKLPPVAAGAVQQALQPPNVLTSAPIPEQPVAVVRPLEANNQPIGPTPLEIARPPVQQAPPVASPAPVMPSYRPPPSNGMMQVTPPDPNILSPIQIAQLMRQAGKSPAEVMLAINDAALKSKEITQGKLYDRRTGKGTILPTGELIETQVFGYPGKTFKLPPNIVARLSEHAENDRPEEYAALAKRFIEGPKFASKELQPQMSVEEKAIEKASQEAGSVKKAQLAAEKESSLGTTLQNARIMFGSASRVEKSLKESSNYFGIFERPGVMGAVGTLFKEGLSVPSGSLKIGGFESAVSKLMPGVNQTDVDNVQKAGADLTEMELAYTKQYMAKEGAITEGERKLARQLPGSVSNSPEFLKARMQILKSRAQYEIDVGDAFYRYREKNPDKNYYDFERKSSEYRTIIKDFEKDTARIAGSVPAISSRERREDAAAAAAAANNPNVSPARQRLDAILRK
jgi:hypothetical protein